MKRAYFRIAGRKIAAAGAISAANPARMNSASRAKTHEVDIVSSSQSAERAQSRLADPLHCTVPSEERDAGPHQFRKLATASATAVRIGV